MQYIFRRTLIFLLLISAVLLFNSPKSVYALSAESPVYIYDDSLRSGFQNWSWKSTINFDNYNPVVRGNKSIKVLPTSGYGAFYMHNSTAVDTSVYKKLELSLYKVDGREEYKLVIYDTSNKAIKSYNLPNTSTNTWKKYTIDLASLNLGTNKISGIAIQENSNLSNIKYYLDEIKFISTSDTASITTTPTPTPTVVSTPKPTITVTPTPLPTVSPTPIQTNAGYYVSGGKIYKNSSEIKLKGVNWFGFEESNHAIHGLWARNYKDMITQMKDLGFNAVRIPVCPASIQGSSVSSVNYSLNPDLQGLNSIQLLDKVVNELNNQGMYILLDHHRPDCNAISELPVISSYSETQWINDLKTLASRYKNVSYFIGIDLKNEPHGASTWGSGNSSTDWDTFAENAGKGVLATNSNILIFVEGISNGSYCSDSNGNWWGGNLQPITCHTLQEAAIPANKLVLSPHVYGPDVGYQSYFSASNFPSNMPTVWDQDFGNLVNKGYAVVPGEWGGKYGNGGLSSDYTWQNALASYLDSKKICSSFYWSWNPNSGDTGGILQDDWKTPWQNKLQLLTKYYANCN
jgi:endoglucanase